MTVAAPEFKAWRADWGPIPPAMIDMRRRILRKARRRLKRCRECGGPILFVKKGEKFMPVDWDEGTAHRQTHCKDHVIHRCKEGEQTRFHLDRDEVSDAKRHADTIEKNVAGRENYTGVTVKGRYWKGRLGEIAVEKWLIERGIPYRTDDRTDGRSDRFDFEICINGEWRRIDVKTYRKGVKPWVMEVQHQAKKQSIDVYLFATLVMTQTGAVVQLNGWMTSRQMSERGQTRLQKFGKDNKTIREWPWATPPFSMSFLNAKAER